MNDSRKEFGKTLLVTAGPVVVIALIVGAVLTYLGY